jgi:hypothetical protein
VGGDEPDRARRRLVEVGDDEQSGVGGPSPVTSWVGVRWLTEPSPAGQPGARGDNVRASYQPLRGRSPTAKELEGAI